MTERGSETNKGDILPFATDTLPTADELREFRATQELPKVIIRRVMSRLNTLSAFAVSRKAK